MEISSLLKYLLPEELLEYFELTGLNESKEHSLFLHLDERNIKPLEHRDKQLVSNAFK